MRTKKLFSVLLAALMLMGTVGVAGASAAGPQATIPPAVEGFDLLVAGSRFIEEDTTKANSNSSAVVVWNSFIAATGIANSDFNYLYDHSSASFDWEVWKVKDALGTDPVVMTDYATEGAAATMNGTWYAKTNSQLVLYINRQTTTTTFSPYYGWVKVRLTVTVSGVPKKSEDIYIELTNPTKLAQLIAEGDKRLGQTDRYVTDYLNNLRPGVAAAKSAIGDRMSATQMQEQIDILQSYLDGYKGDGVTLIKGGKILKLTGWEAFDNLFSKDFIAGWWKFIDGFKKISEIFQPIIDFFSRFGTMLKNIAPFFTFLFGLFTK